MNIFQEIRDKLNDYQGFEIEESTNKLIVIQLSESSFKVSMYTDDDRYTVYYEGWHTQFKDEDEAIKCFLFGLSSDCRLKVTYAGEVAVRWADEALDRTEWVTHDETGSFFYPFWRRKSVRYLSNNIIN